MDNPLLTDDVEAAAAFVEASSVKGILVAVDAIEDLEAKAAVAEFVIHVERAQRADKARTSLLGPLTELVELANMPAGYLAGLENGQHLDVEEQRPLRARCVVTADCKVAYGHQVLTLKAGAELEGSVAAYLLAHGAPVSAVDPAGDVDED